MSSQSPAALNLQILLNQANKRITGLASLVETLEGELAKAWARSGELEAENQRLREVLKQGYKDSFGNWVIPSEFVFDVLKTPQEGE